VLALRKCRNTLSAHSLPLAVHINLMPPFYSMLLDPPPGVSGPRRFSFEVSAFAFIARQPFLQLALRSGAFRFRAIEVDLCGTSRLLSRRTP
jgi:hypothetical protein